MAKRSSSGGGGSTIYGVLAGLLIGLMVAAAVAYYVVKAPSPFVDKASRQPDSTARPDPRNAPDPNAALGVRDTTPIPPSTIGEAPINSSGDKSAESTNKKPSAGKDELGALIATLSPTSPTEPPARVEKPRTEPRKETAKDAAKESSAAGQQNAGSTYYLQAGSFKVLEDAEALRARLIMMGLQVEIQRAEVNGIQFNRVRVGPFSKIDDMNKVRARLGEEKIVTAVVRQ